MAEYLLVSWLHQYSDTMTIAPPYLKPGSTIGITCPSSFIPAEKVDTAAQILRDWGYNVTYGSTVGTNHHYFSGTDEERLADLQRMLDDPAIDAILMGRGGYGMIRILDQLDFTEFSRKPKWVCGFSDITILLNHIERHYGVQSLHSPMCGAIRPDTVDADHIRVLGEILTGKGAGYMLPPAQHNRQGDAEGTLTGGNLSLLAHNIGSQSDIDTAGKILFIEDIEEYLYKMDRMLMALKRAGKFSQLKGLIIGYMTNMLDTDRPFGQQIEEIIADKVKEYSYPVCFGFPSGHEEVNYPLVFGAKHRLTVGTEGTKLELIR